MRENIDKNTLFRKLNKSNLKGLDNHEKRRY